MPADNAVITVKYEITTSNPDERQVFLNSPGLVRFILFPNMCRNRTKILPLVPFFDRLRQIG